MARLVSIEEWAKGEFDEPVPSMPTLLKYAKNGMIAPQPVKAGRRWRVEKTARFVGISATPIIKNTDDKRLKRILEDGTPSQI